MTARNRSGHDTGRDGTGRDGTGRDGTGRDGWEVMDGWGGTATERKRNVCGQDGRTEQDAT